MHPRDVGYLIKTINDKLKVRADRDLKSRGLTLAQSRVLAFLHSRDGKATQKEIEDFMEVSHPTVVGIVSRMEQSGYVTTWIDPKNKRNKMVQLTPQADLIGKTLDSTIQAQEERMLRGLTPEQVTQLEQLLLVIYQNLDEGTTA
ncbi:MAG: MarR family winged helix-turn-helix transcriptional regulator [Oscillospiraceae bacterium]